MKVLYSFLLSGFLLAEDSPDYSKMKVEKVYQTLCASCHGTQFEGGLGGSLVDGKWKYGDSDKLIYRSIRDGNKELGMTAFKTVLSDKKIRSLVIFLREKEKEERFKKRTFPEPKPGEVTETKHHDYQIEIVTKDLTLPWAIAFLPDGSRLVTERRGTLRLIGSDGTLHPDPIKDTPTVVARGQGGLMEVALHPDYETNGWIYLGLSEPHPDDIEKEKPRTLTAVFRGRIKDHRWVEQETIWQGRQEDYSTSAYHFGTRFVFKEGYLFFPVGERGGMRQALDPANAKGKFYRVYDDGRIPMDNPSFGSTTHPGVWSIGHRNPQGVALHPETGEIWSTEHGPRGGDELNLIQPGLNYGWPEVTLGMNYNGTPITHLTEKEGITNPVKSWTPSIAVCGLDFYTGDAFPKWQNHLLVGALRQEEIRRLRLDGHHVVEEEIILKNIGRIRDVAVGSDGFVYALLNEPGQLVRLRPVR